MASLEIQELLGRIKIDVLGDNGPGYNVISESFFDQRPLSVDFSKSSLAKLAL